MSRHSAVRSGALASSLALAMLLAPPTSLAQSPPPSGMASSVTLSECGADTASVLASPLPSAFAGTPDGSSAQPAATLPGAWGTMSVAPVPARTEHSVVWTGSEAVYWAGDGRRDGAAYDPTTDTWRRIARSPLQGRSRHSAVWTGSQMIVWGGGRGQTVRRDGAAYDPATDVWERISSPPTAVGRQRHQAIWTGSRMLVYGGVDARGARVPGGLSYDPATDRWETIPPDPLGPLDTLYVAWTGSAMLLAGYVDGRDHGSGRARLALFDPLTGDWQILLGVELSRYDEPRPVSTDGMVLLIGVHAADAADPLPSSVTLDTEAGCWRTPRTPPPQNDATLDEVWTGSMLLALGQDGVAYVPDSDSWMMLPPAPTDATFRDSVPSVWAGDRVLVWSGLRGESSDPLADGVTFMPGDAP